jgi:cytochrome c oxidase cbb3-type subunit 3
MRSWQEDLSPVKIAQISSYIKSLRGTNPPNAKEKQGELYVEEAADAAPADSTAVTQSSN